MMKSVSMARSGTLDPDAECKMYCHRRGRTVTNQQLKA